MKIPAKPLVVGAPRSGFSLLIAVADSIQMMLVADRRRSPRRKIIHTLVDLCGHYLKESYYRAFRKLGLEEDVIFNGEFHLLAGGPKWLDPENPSRARIRKYIGLKGRGDFLLITSHPNQVLEYHRIVHSHEDPRLWLETPYYDDFVKMASIRNLIGVINSSSFSLNAMASEYIQRFMPEADEHEIRRRHGAYKLTDLEFVRGLVRYYKKYMDAFLEVRDQYFVMKWEDLINSPGPTIMAVARALGVEISEKLALDLWRPMDHKNLLQFHKHNYRRGKGIVGDWKNSLVNEHMELFREEGFEKYLEAFGYPGIPELDPRDYSPFQKLVARYIQRGQIFDNTGDPVLFGLAWNKTNIDASKFNFKSHPRREWTHVERTTVEEDDLVVGVSDAAEEACRRVNRFLGEAFNLDLPDAQRARAALKDLKKQCRRLFLDSENKEAVRLINEGFAGLNASLG